MAENKYPKYVTTDSDFWNSADEAFFFVVKHKAKPFNCVITPIIEQALEEGLLREATEQEIEEYELEQNVERAIREKKIIIGRTYEDTVSNYLKWKENNDKKVEYNPKKAEKITEPFIKKPVELTEDNVEDAIVEPKIKPLPTTIKSTTEVKKPLTPTENALKQKASVRSDNM